MKIIRSQNSAKIQLTELKHGDVFEFRRKMYMLIYYSATEGMKNKVARSNRKAVILHSGEVISLSIPCLVRKVKATMRVDY